MNIFKYLLSFFKRKKFPSSNITLLNYIQLHGTDDLKMWANRIEFIGRSENELLKDLPFVKIEGNKLPSLKTPLPEMHWRQATPIDPNDANG